MSATRLLLVEDRDSLRRMLRSALENEGYAVVEVADGEAAIGVLERRNFDLVLTDLKLPGASGLEVLAAARDASPPIPVVVMTAYGTVEAAVSAMKAGAMDFLEKPVELDELYRIVATVAGRRSDRSAFELPDGSLIVGSHPRLLSALRLVEKVAPTDSTVLITGESGTGKELFARALHAGSNRAAGPFVAVNCAAIPESLLENELFGHEKGSYTGANRREAGRFELASGGTLLLDEIGELGLGVQAKVLRVLEERTFERIGGSRTLEADARLVGTTNRDLDQMVAAGTFRSDLFYRLNVFPIHLPSLAMRSSDVPALAAYLVQRAAASHARPETRLADSALRLLEQRPWPGNVRQLANVLSRAVILSDSAVISATELKALFDPLDRDALERQLRRALEDADGDTRRAAQELGVSYRTLRRRILAYELEGYPHHHRRS